MRQGAGHKKLKGFTLIEVLVVLALTSLSVGFSFTSLNMTQQLFVDYRKQARFLNDLTAFKQRCDYEALHADWIVENKPQEFEFKRDSLVSLLRIEQERILWTMGSRCDTFHFSAKGLKLEYEPMRSAAWQQKLLAGWRFETEFGKQRFVLVIRKQHDAATKLALENLQNHAEY